MKPQDKKIFKERIKSFFPQATPSGVEQLMSLLINCCCIDLCSINNADDIQFTSLEVVGNTLSITLTINGTPVTQSTVLPANIVTTMTNTVAGNLIGTYTNEVGIAIDINETITNYNDLIILPKHQIGNYINENGTTTPIYETLSTFVDNGDGTFTHTNENNVSTTIDINNLLTTDVELFTVNAGTTATSTDNSLGEQIVTVGDILHFWSSNGSVNFNVQAGSVVTDMNTEASIIPYTPTTPLTSTNIQDAIDELANNTHIPVTTLDSPTINFTQSGVDFQTITADLVGSNTATIGQIPTSDGNGNITWTTPTATILADNGLTETLGTIELGGTLIHDTFIDDTTANTNKLIIGNTTPINSFIVNSQTENRIATTINDYNAYLRTMSNYNRLEVSSDINPEIARVDTTAVIGQATTNISAYDGTESAQTNYNAQSGNTYATTIVTNGIDTNTLTITATTLQSSIHPNTRDDSGVNTPINFLYTDSSGIVQSAPTSLLSGNSWLLNGNAGTDGGVTNFLGTTDAQDLVLKTNGVTVARFSDNASQPTTGSIIFGSDDSTYGTTSTATGSNTIAAGQNNTVTGDLCLVGGLNNTVSNNGHVCFGARNVVSGAANSLCGGVDNVVNGDIATTFGGGNTVDATGGFACGNGGVIDNTAGYSAVFNSENTAKGLFTNAFGNFNTAYSLLETVFGYYSTTYTPISTNIWQPFDRLFTIGNGTSNVTRNNALTMWKDGRCMFNGDVAKQNTWIGVNGKNAQNFVNVSTSNTFAGFSTEHTPSGNFAVFGSTGSNSGITINNTNQFAFTTTSGTQSTVLGATVTAGSYSLSGWNFGGGAIATSTVDVRGTLGLSNIRIDTANPVLNTNNTVYHFTGGASGTIDMTAHKVDNRTIVLTNYSGVSLTLSDAVRKDSATTITALPNNTSIIVAYDGVEFFKIN